MHTDTQNPASAWVKPLALAPFMLGPMGSSDGTNEDKPVRYLANVYMTTDQTVAE